MVGGHRRCCSGNLKLGAEPRTIWRCRWLGERRMRRVPCCGDPSLANLHLSTKPPFHKQAQK